MKFQVNECRSFYYCRYNAYYDLRLKERATCFHGSNDDTESNSKENQTREKDNEAATGSMRAGVDAGANEVKRIEAKK